MGNSLILGFVEESSHLLQLAKQSLTLSSNPLQPDIPHELENIIQQLELIQSHLQSQSHESTC